MRNKKLDPNSKLSTRYVIRLRFNKVLFSSVPSTLYPSYHEGICGIDIKVYIFISQQCMSAVSFILVPRVRDPVPPY
jgi:hypothetical protein